MLDAARSGFFATQSLWSYAASLATQVKRDHYPPLFMIDFLCLGTA